MTAVQSICGVAIAAMAFAVCYEIVARTVFGEPTIWAQEISVYLLIAVAFLGLGPTLAAGEHIEIDLFTRKLPAALRRPLRAMILLAIAAYAVVAAYGGIEIVRQSVKYGRRSLTLLSVPVWIPQLLVPIGMVLLAAAALFGFWTIVRPQAESPRDG